MKIFIEVFKVSIIALLVVGFVTFAVIDPFCHDKAWYLKYKKIMQQVLRWGAVIILASAAIALAITKIE